MILQPTTLQQRISWFVLIPVFIFLAFMGGGGFLYARYALLNQWGETAVAELQKAAHLIDMRLRGPKELLTILNNSPKSADDHLIHDFIFDQIREMDGVKQVRVQWPSHTSSSKVVLWQKSSRDMMGMRYYRMDRPQITPPKYDPSFNDETVSLVSELKNKDNRLVGRVEVVIGFHDLIAQIIKEPWWKSNKAFLLNNTGKIFSSIMITKEEQLGAKRKVFGQVNLLEKQTLEALENKNKGTIFGKGYPPDEISGFFRLAEAPWSLVIISPGQKVLAPILRFTLLYSTTGAIFIGIILIFIRAMMSQTVSAIKIVSKAAAELANGEFGSPLPISGKDEVSELTRNFNLMTTQLQKGNKLQKAMDIAREVQQNLLPQTCFQTKEIELCGKSIYCSETGGDYFDIIKLPGDNLNVAVVVGDVVGHGIGAALLMATTRGLFRSRILQPGSLSEIISDINNVLYMDTANSGSFVSLFCMTIDPSQQEINWVRAGHDPAIVYAPRTGNFSEIQGDGVILGVSGTWQYEQESLSIHQEELIILIGTDGVWDTENCLGEKFGKERVKENIKKYSHLRPAEMINELTTKVAAFRGDGPQTDDITLMVIKLNQNTK